MADVKVRVAHASDVWYIGEHMRKADVDEAAAMGYTPVDALESGLRASTVCWTALVDDMPCLMFGVAPISILGGIGAPWLLGTTDMRKIRKKFIRESAEYLSKMQTCYPTLRNYVDVRNDTSIRWLRWLGFEMSDPLPVGVNGELFHPFEIRRKAQCA